MFIWAGYNIYMFKFGKNKEGAPKEPSAMERKREEIIDAVVDGYLEKHNAEFSAGAHNPNAREDFGLAQEKKNRDKLRGAIESFYRQYMEDSQGVPPTFAEFNNYVESQLEDDEEKAA